MSPTRPEPGKGYQYQGGDVPRAEHEAALAQLVRANSSATALYTKLRAAEKYATKVTRDLQATRLEADALRSRVAELVEALSTEVEAKEKARAVATSHQETFRKLLAAAQEK